ncbi:TIGR02594 family protein [Massilia sp. P8910]|uniref:TIGR02594 family protein n=1 Tax=Massilia antarctica TaxID=2765360 RepID=UPI001E53783A|nr:TIGR02594 family protein [Massilia antarctica]MCE3608297.1 TIGR02594 family protein [Massilia antarctica]
MYEIIDTPSNVSDYATRLAQDGVRTVIRYYNNQNSSTFPTKCLTKEEFATLTAAGLSIAVVFQQRGGAGGFLDDFATGKGIRDAQRALSLATNIGQPQDSAIYFGVDHDFFRAEELSVIDAYFAEVNQEFGGHYRVGVYGSGAVCSCLKASGQATLFWLPASMGWSGSRAFLASSQWTLFQKLQNLQSDVGHFGYDGNLFNPAYADFGQFAADQPQAQPTSGVRSSVTRIAVMEVIARSGLRLRGGPSLTFAALETLPLGAVVQGLRRDGDWIQVDINGDGLADGFAASAFLKPLAGGLPIPEQTGASPYAVAQAELALGVREIPGAGNNPRIVLYHSTTEGGGAPDQTAWCSSFVNYCVEQAGLTGTNSKRARSWHDDHWGQEVTDDPRTGDIVVWQRQSPTDNGGHVGFFVEKINNDVIRVLGGNQGQRVKMSDYPVDGTLGSTKYTLLSIRR